MYLNQVEQQGVTPLSLTDVQPGTYRVEIVLPHHLPAVQQGEVQALEFTTVRMELTPNYGQLEITSQPEGALVYLNDEQRGRTPFSARMEAGLYALRLVRDLHHDAHDTLRIEPGDQVVEAYPLRPRFGTVEVTSEPSGARVLVDGVASGETPLTLGEVFSGSRMVRVELEPYPPQERAVQVRDAESHPLHFDLSRSVGYLTVSSEPPGAQVALKESGERDRELGLTPLSRAPLPPGTYTLIISLPDHEPAERTVPVAPGDTPRLQVTLKRYAGHVRVVSTPPQVKIFVNDERRPRDETPTVLRDLPVGRHRLRFERDGYDPVSQWVVVERNAVTDHRLTLGTAGTQAWQARRAQARKLAVVPGLGQVISPGQGWRGVLYAAGFGAAGYLAYQAHTDYGRAERRYGDARQAYTTYDQRRINQHYDAALKAGDDQDSARRRFTMALTAVGAVYGVQWLDALIFGGGRREAYVRSAATQAEPALQAAVAADGLGLSWRLWSR